MVEQRGGVGGSVRAVQAYDGVEVDQPAALVFGDLGERQPTMLRPVAGTDTQTGGQGAAQVGGEPRPQRARVGLPQHRADVVVGLRVKSGADPWVVAVVAVPAGAAQKVADDLVDAGVRIIFNYSEGLLDVPSDVTVHTSNPAVELLHALYFHLA